MLIRGDVKRLSRGNSRLLSFGPGPLKEQPPMSPDDKVKLHVPYQYPARRDQSNLPVSRLLSPITSWTDALISGRGCRPVGVKALPNAVRGRRACQNLIRSSRRTLSTTGDRSKPRHGLAQGVRHRQDRNRGAAQFTSGNSAQRAWAKTRTRNGRRKNSS